MFTTIFSHAHTFDVGLRNDEVYDVKAVARDKICWLHVNGIKCLQLGKGFIERKIRGFVFSRNRPTRLIFGDGEKEGYEVVYEDLNERLTFADAESFAYEPFSRFGFVEWDDKRVYVNHIIYGKKRIRAREDYEEIIIGENFVAMRIGDEWTIKSFDLRRVASMRFLEEDNHDVEIGEFGYAVMFSERALKAQKALIFRLSNIGLLAIGQIQLLSFSAKRTIKDRGLFVSGGYVIYHVGKPKPTIWAIAPLEPRGIYA